MLFDHHGRRARCVDQAAKTILRFLCRHVFHQQPPPPNELFWLFYLYFAMPISSGVFPCPCSQVQLHRRRGAAGMDADRDFEVLAEADDDCHEPVDCEAVEIGFADAGEVGSRDAGDLTHGAHGQIAVTQYADDLGGEPRAQLFTVGIGMAEITEDAAAAADESLSFTDVTSPGPGQPGPTHDP